ncbi:MAG: ATP-binding protein [Burkholderiaceae bacterium]|nr:ATP-binding protein [Burkholderiaceae bacterium]MCD8516289.1 ATP-binding protein [Burkholderiaceae bacterium]MCD8537159.1 ATP-binding protein [Burkholderiaceae bacterium]MCD8566308.1 ATP-binding protein [Burkholderiaceae bacterium]
MTAIEPYDLLATTILLLDRDGVVVRANAAAEALFGRSRRQLEGQMAIALFDEDVSLAQSVLHACEGTLESCRQVAMVARQGVPREVSVTTLSLMSQPWSALIEVADLESRSVVDRTQRLAEEIQVQHELLRNLAHEVKNPLGGLRGAAQLLEAELPDRRLTEYTQVIISEADRLQALVDRLAAPHASPMQIGEINIHEVCERVCALVQAEFADVELARDYDASMPEIKADSARLVQALLNVVRNAAQILTQSDTPEPRVVVRTRIARQIMLHRRQHRMVAEIAVIDNGPGVPPAIQDKVFHPLVTAREGGTGLGLSLAQDLLQQHGGLIEMESKPGHTEFRLLIPMELS